MRRCTFALVPLFPLFPLFPLTLVACGQAAPPPVTAPTSTVASPSPSVPADCGAGLAYVPAPAWSGRAPELPAVPLVPELPAMVDGAYTVSGAVRRLRSLLHAEEVTRREISIIGYIVESNIPNAPACAVHPTGKRDPEGCVTEIPTFAIADAKGDASTMKVRVMGWASTFSNVYVAMQKYKQAKDSPKDELWAVDIPYPLPAVGAKVRVTGRYGTVFGKSSAGLVTDPLSGVMTYRAIETLERAPEAAAFRSTGRSSTRAR